MILMSVCRLLGALRTGTCGKRRHINTSARQSAVEFLPPMCDIARGSVAVQHAAWSIADIGQLMEHSGRDVDGLAGVHHLSLFAETHLRGAFDDEIDFLLHLVVPG